MDMATHDEPTIRPVQQSVCAGFGRVYAVHGNPFDSRPDSDYLGLAFNDSWELVLPGIGDFKIGAAEFRPFVSGLNIMLIGAYTPVAS